VGLLLRIMPEVERAVAAGSGLDASLAFYARMQPLGANYIQTRLYRRPAAALTSASHWAAGGRIVNNASAAWHASAAADYVCFECNPLLTAIRENRTLYRFGDFAPHSRAEFGAYWDAMSELGVAEALCATSYGAEGLIASVHLGFAHDDFDAEEARAVQLAGLVLTERLLDFGGSVEKPTALTGRERDVLCYVADGKTDWEIATIMGLSEATARFHVDNARRKLGAVNRAQAAARFAVSGGI